MKNIKLHNQTDPDCPPIHAVFCDTFLCRFRGLMWRKSLSPHEGLLLVESSQSRMNAAIHMLFMKFDIAAIWLNDHLQVVDAQLARRWQGIALPQSPARYILEIHPSRLTDFHIGDQLRYEDD